MSKCGENEYSPASNASPRLLLPRNRIIATDLSSVVCLGIRTPTFNEERRVNGRNALVRTTPLARIVKVHDVLGGDGHAVAHGGMEAPALQHVQHLLLDAVADALNQLRL